MLAHAHAVAAECENPDGIPGTDAFGLQANATARFLEELEETLDRLGSAEVEIDAFLVDVAGLSEQEVRRIASRVSGPGAFCWMLSATSFVVMFLTPPHVAGRLDAAVQQQLNDAAWRADRSMGAPSATVQGVTCWSYEIVIPALLLRDLMAVPPRLLRPDLLTAA